MKTVSKAEFKALYFRLGGGDATGWGLDYWNRFFETNEHPLMKYCVEEPPTSDHTRMMIVTDFAAKEYRLFFMTEEAEERFCEFPGAN